MKKKKLEQYIDLLAEQARIQENIVNALNTKVDLMNQSTCHTLDSHEKVLRELSADDTHVNALIIELQNEIGNINKQQDDRICRLTNVLSLLMKHFGLSLVNYPQEVKIEKIKSKK